MSSSTRIIRCLSLALAVSALVAPVAQAGTAAESREAAFRAAHWKHEDSLYDASRGTSVPTAPLDAHWKHEDALYAARSTPSSAPQPAPAAVESREGNAWSRAMMAAGGLVALAVLGAALTGMRRNRRLAPS